MESKRKPNFTFNECNLLLDLIQNHKHILESKKTDTTGRFAREKAWEKIVMDFNQTSGEVYRDKQVLKSKYENLKKATKKKVCEEKKYVCGTGGGPSKSSDFNDLDSKVKDLLGDERIEGLQSRFDNDAAEPSPFIVSVPPADELDDNEEVTQLDQDDEHQQSVPVVIDLDPTWGSYSVNNLRQPRSVPLLPKSRPTPHQQAENQPLESDDGIRPKNIVAACLEKRVNLHKTKPYKKPAGEKEIWETVGQAKMELLQVQKEIALAELKREERQNERLEEEHQLKLKHMKELHKLRTQLLEAELKEYSNK